MKEAFTLCCVHTDRKILLGMKKRGLGTGRWNGFGGHVEAGETVEEAAIREVKEESGLDVKNIRKMGELNFYLPRKDGGMMELLVHVFSAREFSGEVVETDEMRPQWFGLQEIPFEKMWQDDRFWLPYLLEGKRFAGSFTFDKDDNIITSTVDLL